MNKAAITLFAAALATALAAGTPAQAGPQGIDHCAPLKTGALTTWDAVAGPLPGIGKVVIEQTQPNVIRAR